ncbi:MAG: 4Fe-4S dicluster domain-containing protein [Acidobacteriota bacterium]|nr:4Fe-4S dicluster domain-containing protein [Acidobacteriota bacterium]MDH3523884.1 4Fe-4S dicluster domain-containing protein [Acidobacteriota bacterium]
MTEESEERGCERREFLVKLLQLPCSAAMVTVLGPLAAAAETGDDGAQRSFGMGIQIDRCIGCGNCVEACKAENDVPREPYYFRTWVERYTIHRDGEVSVESPEGGIRGFPPREGESDERRSFFVPKLCNQCDNPPCVQVCPVGATFKTEDGVVLVDSDYCIGCRYCIQACPYGARYLDPRTATADKCTFCYHRITRGLSPACVEVCPTGARVFGELDAPASPLRRLMRMSALQVLKPALNTEPKVFYSNLDGEVR